MKGEKENNHVCLFYIYIFIINLGDNILKLLILKRCEIKDVTVYYLLQLLNTQTNI